MLLISQAPSHFRPTRLWQRRDRFALRSTRGEACQPQSRSHDSLPDYQYQPQPTSYWVQQGRCFHKLEGLGGVLWKDREPVTLEERLVGSTGEGRG